MANKVLGNYYEHNQSFDSSNYISNLPDLNDTIHYYRQAARLITSLPNYPADKSMTYYESTRYISYRIFTRIPELYLDGYFYVLDDIEMNSFQRATYSDTLEALDNAKQTATTCIERPALHVWGGKRDVVYKALQVKCNAYREFATAVYALEKERMQIAQDCSTLECSEYEEVMIQIDQLIKNMFDTTDTAPPIH